MLVTYVDMDTRVSFFHRIRFSIPPNNPETKFVVFLNHLH